MTPASAETAPLARVLLNNAAIAPGAQTRLLPNLDVKAYDRLHFHIARAGKSVAGLSVRVLFGTPVAGSGITLLADSTVWFEETLSEREFIWTAPATFNRTGFVVSVPVVAPTLYDLILTNTSATAMDQVYVTLLAQEI